MQTPNASEGVISSTGGLQEGWGWRGAPAPITGSLGAGWGVPLLSLGPPADLPTAQPRWHLSPRVWPRVPSPTASAVTCCSKRSSCRADTFLLPLAGPCPWDGWCRWLRPCGMAALPLRGRCRDAFRGAALFSGPPRAQAGCKERGGSRGASVPREPPSSWVGSPGRLGINESLPVQMSSLILIPLSSLAPFMGTAG